MQPAQTPFQLIQRRDRQRKINVLNNIEKKDLRRRSISYNFKATDNTYSENAEDDDKNEAKQHFSHIAISNSIKKSYYYRKLLNKSIDAHLTSQEFQKVKQKFDRVDNKDSSNDNKSPQFRQIWQREHFKKYALKLSHQQQNNLEIVSKNSQKYKTLGLQSGLEVKKKDQAAKSILDIAQQRRTTLNFDLQILGNKKSIRIKDNCNKMKISATQSIKTGDIYERYEKQSNRKDIGKAIITTIQRQNKYENSPNRALCSFFKRLQQENSQPKQLNNNQFLQITKINQSFFPVSNSNQLDNFKLKKLKLKEYLSQVEQTRTPIVSRQIQSSWKPSPRLSEQNYIKVLTSHERRANLSKTKRTQIPAFTNDIKGWMVGQQNDQYPLDNFEN